MLPSPAGVSRWPLRISRPGCPGREGDPEISLAYRSWPEFRIINNFGLRVGILSGFFVEKFLRCLGLNWLQRSGKIFKLWECFVEKSDMSRAGTNEENSTSHTSTRLGFDSEGFGTKIVSGPKSLSESIVESLHINQPVSFEQGRRVGSVSKSQLGTISSPQKWVKKKSRKIWEEGNVLWTLVAKLPTILSK